MPAAERVAHWPGTSVQEAGQAGRGRGEEGRLPALERWGRGRGATAPPGHCAPADFHGRLPRSSRRRPGAGHSLGFKRHSRNVNNPGGRASGPERARIAGLGPPPFPGDSRSARLLCPSVYLPQTFFSSALQFHLVPPARSRARASPTTRAQGAWDPAPDPAVPAARSLLMPRAWATSAPGAAAPWAGSAKSNWGLEPACLDCLLALSRPPSRGSFPRSPPSPFP